MSFLRRLLGGAAQTPPAATQLEAVDSADVEAGERDRERELATEDARRLDDLGRRQLRYADYAWTPPREGGERRADDADADAARAGGDEA